MSKLKSIELGFENIDTMVINKENIVAFSLSDIVEYIENFHYSEIVNKHKISKSVYLVLKNTKETIHKELEVDKWKISVYNKLTLHCDIVDITVHYEDGTKEQYFVDFNSEYDDYNINQTHKYDEQNDYLEITIKEE